MRQETGRRQVVGDRRRETGVGTQETGARGSQETGDSRHETVDMRKTGDRRQCSDVKSGCTKIKLLLFL